MNAELPNQKPTPAKTIRINATEVGDAPLLQPFSEFGEYTILTRLGEGGMGIVYGAKHRTLNRRVALKMMRSGQLASADETTRFRREAQAAAKLNHPNVVPIYEIGKHAGFTFFSMEYIVGETLSAFNTAARVRDAGWMRTCARLIAKVARAVQHAHENQVLHRDIKPGNILLDEAGEPHVTDFGLAKFLETDAPQTLSGNILGTPEYMSPEQASGSGDIKAASDIFSLGAVLYHLLTGTFAFRDVTPLKTMQQVVRLTPKRLRELNPEVPRDLEVICLKCLEKEPIHRYSTARELADELERWLDGRPIVSRPSGPAERAWKWVRRNPRLAAISGAAALIALIGSSAITWQWRRAEKHRVGNDLANTRLEIDRAEQLFSADNPSLALALLARVLRNEPGNRGAASRAINALSQRKFLVPVSPALAEKVKFGAFTSDGRVLLVAADTNGETLSIIERTGALVVRIPLNNERVLAASTSFDGRLIAAGTENGAHVWKASDGSLVDDLKLGQPVHAVHFREEAMRPGQTTLALAGTNSVMLWNSESHALVTAAALDDFLVLATFAPDNSRIAVATEMGRIAIVAPGESQVCRVISNAHARVIRSLRFNSDVRMLVSGSADGTAKIWNALNGELLGSLPVGQTVVHAEFNYDSTRVVIASRNNTAQLWDWSKGQLIGNAMTHIAGVNIARFSPDGQWILTASDDGVTRLWVAQNGGPGAQAIRSAQPIADASFSHDGKLILSVEDGGSAILLTSIGGRNAEPHRVRVKVSDNNGAGAIISKSDAEMFATAHTAEVIFTDDAPDGTRVATASLDRTARIWDRTTHRPAIEPLVHDAPVNCVRFSPDGTLLVTSTTSRRVRIWDSASGQPITDWFTSSDPVSQVWITPNNTNVVTAEGTMWNISSVTTTPPSWLAELAEAVAGIRYTKRHISEPVAGPAILNLRSMAHTNCDHSLCDWLRDLLHELPAP